MQNIFKKIALILTVALSVVCLSVFAAACGDSEKATEFVITLLDADGNEIELTEDGEYTIQICDASNYFCYAPEPDFVDGKATFNIAKVESSEDAVYDGEENGPSRAYVVHVIHIGEIREEVETKTKVTLTRSNAEVTVQLKG